MSKTDRHFRGFAVLLMLAGCGGASAEQVTKAVPTTTMGPPIWLELRTDFVLDGRPLSQALVLARLGEAPGIEGWWFADTGAGAPFVNIDLIASSGLKSRKQDVTVRDMQSEKSQVIDVVDTPSIKLASGQQLEMPAILGIPLPPPFVKAGIVGGLNPQMLSTAEDAVVLDLARQRMAVMPVAQARGLHQGPRLDDLSTRVCKKTEAGIDSFVFVTDVEIGGRTIPFEFDTGARLSMFAKDHPASRALFNSSTEEVEMKGMAGKSSNRLARNVPVRIAGYEVVVPEMPIALGKAPEEACGFYGLIGADILGDCILVLEPDAISVSCIAGSGSREE